jgi:transmembrane sensor
MSERESATRIDEVAADWVARCDADALDAEGRARLEAWLAGDPRRRGAFLRAQAAWAFLDRGQALAGRADADFEGDAAPRLEPRPRWRSWRIPVVALAASMAAAVAFVAFDDGRYSTTLGEVSRIPLEDGTVASLNTDSRMDVSMSPQARSVNLIQGEAWFHVARDPSRPFVVASGNTRVRALGTAFAVRKRDGGSDVLVTEGTVSAWVVGQEDRAVRLSAGAAAFVAEVGPPPRVSQAPERVDRSLAWRSGQIALHGQSLRDAVAEFNRHNARRLVVVDPALASQPLVGRFRTNEPEAFAHAAAAALGAHVVAGDGEIQLIPGATP